MKVGRLVGYAVGAPRSFAGIMERDSEVEGFHLHHIRHTFACRWVEVGGNLALQKILGHASIVTKQPYARLTDEAVMREAARIGGKACSNGLK